MLNLEWTVHARDGSLFNPYNSTTSGKYPVFANYYTYDKTISKQKYSRTCRNRGPQNRIIINVYNKCQKTSTWVWKFFCREVFPVSSGRPQTASIGFNKKGSQSVLRFSYQQWQCFYYVRVRKRIFCHLMWIGLSTLLSCITTKEWNQPSVSSMESTYLVPRSGYKCLKWRSFNLLSCVSSTKKKKQ